MRDFCDGCFVRQNSIFQAHKDALQLILYYDDIEVANPLGSKAGTHKLGKYHNQCILPIKFAELFYYVLGNIRPVFRSTLQALQLICVAKTDDIKAYGCKTLLQPFLDQANQLDRVCMNLHMHLNLYTCTQYRRVATIYW